MFNYSLWKILFKRLDKLEREIRTVRFMVTRTSGSVGIKLLEESDMAFKFAVDMPRRPASDSAWKEITGGKLQVRWGGKDPLVFDTPKSAQEGTTPESLLYYDDRFVALDGDLVETTFQHVDNAGNLSIPISNVTEVVDVIPPVAPESIGIKLLEEVEDPQDPPFPQPVE